MATVELMHSGLDKSTFISAPAGGVPPGTAATEDTLSQSALYRPARFCARTESRYHSRFCGWTTTTEPISPTVSSAWGFKRFIMRAIKSERQARRDVVLIHWPQRLLQATFVAQTPSA
eukprot:scaffold23627_cov60-Phaeocystis_antarctica.AAC.3